ncbi:hypothetical protein ACFL0W_00145 [Nanoarchaeota archaeon]
MELAEVSDLTPDKAADLLGNVKKSRHFNVHMGASIGSLHQLIEALDVMSKDSFEHHINEHKNDFAKWIEHSVEDIVLAVDVKDLKNRDKIKKAIEERIAELEKIRSKGKLISAHEWMNYGVVDFVLGVLVGFLAGVIISVFV